MYICILDWVHRFPEQSTTGPTESQPVSGREVPGGPSVHKWARKLAASRAQVVRKSFASRPQVGRKSFASCSQVGHKSGLPSNGLAEVQGSSRHPFHARKRGQPGKRARPKGYGDKAAMLPPRKLTRVVNTKVQSPRLSARVQPQ